MSKYLTLNELELNEPVLAARSLLGKKIIYNNNNQVLSGYIVETEAYHSDDPASHSFHGLTKSNKSLFMKAGTIYVYFTYGMHFCINIVTGEEGQGQAVLIRAIEPVDGIEVMKENRKTDVVSNLTNGPAKLTQAFGINKSIDGSNVIKGPIFLTQGTDPKEIVVDTRIGISRAIDYPWRFYIKDNPFVSKLSKLNN